MAAAEEPEKPSAEEPEKPSAALVPEFVFEVIDRSFGNKRVLKVRIMLDGTEVGNFDISGTAPGPKEKIIHTQIEPFFSQGNTIDLGIFIEDEYKKQKWSTPMIAKMIESIGDQMSDHQLLFIDVDASEGFWGHMGFKENKYFGDTKRTPVGQGYEGVITWGELKKYIAQRPTKGGKRTRRKKRKSRSYK